MAETTETKKSVFQFIKFALFSCSAGIIQIGSFTLMNEVLLNMDFMQKLIAENETFAKIMTNEYGPFYLIALILSVIWNFTFNRKFTFKSAANIPVAMLKVFGFYLVFTPVSTILGNYFTAQFATVTAIEYIVLGVTMLCNMITEYLFCKFVVYRNQENTAVKVEEKV
ncbi:MAG: GtrA family protein [Clostridia bacterium]|nr:GtrA family protein [Clostridia bacterium]